MEIVFLLLLKNDKEFFRRGGDFISCFCNYLFAVDGRTFRHHRFTSRDSFICGFICVFFIFTADIIYFSEKTTLLMISLVILELLL